MGTLPDGLMGALLDVRKKGTHPRGTKRARFSRRRKVSCFPMCENGHAFQCVVGARFLIRWRAHFSRCLMGTLPKVRPCAFFDALAGHASRGAEMGTLLNA